MNLEADNTILEDYGAGFEGTDALRDKYIKDTPEQRIQHFKTEMKQKTYQEFEAQHKKMYPSHTEDQIKAAYKKYSEYIEIEEGKFSMRQLYAVVDSTNNTVVGTASSEEAAQRIIRSAHLPPISSKNKDKLKVVKTKKVAEVGYPLDEAYSESEIEYLLNKWRETGRIAYRRPNKKLISLNGGPNIPEKQALDKIKDFFDKQSEMDEAMDPQNTSYGYYGTVDVEKYKLIAYKEMADKVLKIARDKKIFVNFPNITSNTDQESAVVKYLDSRHGRRIADGNDSPIYIEKDFTKFLKDVAAGHYIESVDLDEAINIELKEGNSFGGSLRSLGFIKMTDAEVKKAYYKWASKINPGFIGWEQPMDKYAVGFGKDGRFFIVNKRNPSEIDFYTGEKATLAAVRNLKEESNLEEAINIRDYMATSEKSQFGGYTPKVVHKDGKTMYSGQASYNTPDEAKDHAEDYLKQYARGIREPRVPVKGTYVKESTEEISLEERRQMKIVALATGSTDLDKIYEYVTTQPVQYSSVVELKESFNKYINTP